MTLYYSVSYDEPTTAELADWLLQASQKPRASTNGCGPRRQQQQQRPASAAPAAARPAAEPFKTVCNVGDVAFDIFEKKDAFELVADAPGFSTDDITIELHEKVLTVSGTPSTAQHQQQQAEQPKTEHKRQSSGNASPAPAEHKEEQSKEDHASSEASSDWTDGAASPKQQQDGNDGSSAAEQKATAAEVKVTHVKEEKSEGEKVKVWRRERQVRPFLRAFVLPEHVSRDDIAASLDKGVLTVRVPKLPEAPKPAPRRIAVQSVA